MCCFTASGFERRAGEAKNIDVLLGDEGGISDLLVLPVGALTEPEKKLQREHLSDKSLTGPVFPAKAAGRGSLPGALKKP